jgi:hypothetical protein
MNEGASVGGQMSVGIALQRRNVTFLTIDVNVGDSDGCY